MRLNFFNVACQHPPISLNSFGLCDDQNGTIAYPDTGRPNLWVAEVKNSDNLNITFTSIDKCVINDHEYQGRGRCDGMLTTHEHLYLVELKNQFPPWQAHAIRQLESTIDFLKANHNIDQFKKRKAFASNKKRGAFVEIDNEFNIQFFRRTSFRIDIQATIVIL